MRVMQRPKKSPPAKLLALTLTFAMLLGIAITAAAAPAYPDISGHWGETAIEKWSNYDVLHGNDLGTFDPDGELDVTQLAQILVNTFGYTESYTGSLPGYTSSWGEEAVRKAVAAGAIEASEAALPLTRELAAKIVAKAFGISPVSGASKFSDDYAISSEYKPYAAAIGRAGIFNGNDYGELMPSDAFSRAQIMQALDNAVTDIVKENKAAESAKSVILNKDGVTLTEGVIEGDLIIAQGVGDGDITLDGVTVNGRLVIFGGGANSIHIKGKSSIANVTIAKTFGQAARLVVESADAVVGTVTIIAESKATVATTNGAEIAKIEVVPETEVSETGAVEAATVTAATTVTISAKAAAVEIAAENAALTISSGATITSLTVETKAAVTVASGATVTAAIIEASDVKLSGAGKVTAVTVTEDAKTGVEVTTNGTKITTEAGAGKVSANASGQGSSNDDIFIAPDRRVSVSFIYEGEKPQGHEDSLILPAAIKVLPGGTIEKPEDAEFWEHRFDGWFADAALTEEFDFTAEITVATTVYAKLTAIHTVTYTYDATSIGGDAGVILVEQVLPNTTTTPPAAPTIDGYMFVEWYYTVQVDYPGYGTISTDYTWNPGAPVTSKTDVKARYIKSFDGLDGDIAALSFGTAATKSGYRAVPAIAGGEAYPMYNVSFAALPHGGLPVKATAFSSDMFITYASGVYRVKTDGSGYITEFYADFDTIKEGYGVAKADGKLVLGVIGDEYEYTEDTKYYNIDGYVSAPITLDDVPVHNKLHYWAVPDDVDGATLKELYINYPSYAPVNLTAMPTDKLENIAKFRTVIPDGRTPEAGAPLKYAYFDPEPYAAGADVPLVVWMHGSGFGTNVWDTFFSDSDTSPNYIAKWASSEYQEFFGAQGAYILAPSANVHPVLGAEHRWGDADGDQIELAFDLIDQFITDHPDIDTNRIYIGGFSVGAGMTMLMARERPDFFAAAFPCSPTARTLYDSEAPENTAAVAEILATLPIWLFHSNAEGLTTVGPTYSQDFIAAMLETAEANDTDSRYTLFDDSVTVQGPYGPSTGFYLPNKTSTTSGHGISWAAALNNLLYNDGTSYLGTEKNITQGLNILGGGATTLLTWLAAQSLTDSD